MKELLSRKFLFSILAILLAFVLVLQGMVKSEDFLSFVQVIGATYIVGNVASKFAGNTDTSEK